VIVWLTNQSLFLVTFMFRVHIYDVDFAFQDVAKPSDLCSVCGLPRMAKKQEPLTVSLTQRFETIQPASFRESDSAVESEELSALSRVENTGSFDSTDVQNKGSSDFCSAVSQLMSSGTFSADDDLESTLKITEVRSLADIECQQYQHQMQNVENTGLSDGTDVQSKGLSDSCFSKSPLINNVVLSANDDPERTLENADTESPLVSNGVLSANDGPESTLKSTAVESTGLSSSKGVHNIGSSAESPLVSSLALSASDNPEPMSENTEDETLADSKCSQYGNCDLMIADGQIAIDSEQLDQGLVSFAQGDVVNDAKSLPSSRESGSPHTDDVDACSSKALMSLPSVTDTATTCDDMAAEESSVSDGNLGEMLSCAECGSSGLYFLRFF